MFKIFLSLPIRSGRQRNITLSAYWYSYSPSLYISSTQRLHLLEKHWTIESSEKHTNLDFEIKKSNDYEAVLNQMLDAPTTQTILPNPTAPAIIPSQSHQSDEDEYDIVGEYGDFAIIESVHPLTETRWYSSSDGSVVGTGADEASVDDLSECVENDPSEEQEHSIVDIHACEVSPLNGPLPIERAERPSIRHRLKIETRTDQTDNFVSLHSLIGREEEAPSSSSSRSSSRSSLQQDYTVYPNSDWASASFPLNELRAQSLFTVPTPRLNIAILVVGTRGDLQPFLALADNLKNQGHRVRVATHACYRDLVVQRGFEFYPLAGDPKRLSEFMVRNQGCLVPLSSESLLEVSFVLYDTARCPAVINISLLPMYIQIPSHMAMLSAIIESCYDACVSPDPLDPTPSDRYY